MARDAGALLSARVTGVGVGLGVGVAAGTAGLVVVWPPARRPGACAATLPATIKQDDAITNIIEYFMQTTFSFGKGEFEIDLTDDI